MLRVALTGGLGSGKSTAAAMFRDLGCAVSQSDEVARAMMQPGEAVYQAIVQHFGPGVLRADESLDRAALADLAFRQGRAAELNAIVHPPVIAWQNAWMADEQAKHPCGIAMVESALVFEARSTAGNSPEGLPGTAWRGRFDRIIVVTAAEKIRVERFVDRCLTQSGGNSNADRASAEADARARMARQMPEGEKAALADAVIVNDGSLDDLRGCVHGLWQQLQSEARVGTV